ncbi:PAS domain-containing sensor histidine kinase [Azospirillum canadense]|uniref:PAS domain-containing sensor histidine kinase n=1 Tax=Azospirillum canadense TaxID=403962 RepID=UPI0022280707|nr:PAS domain-containing sensor histidine kinase [Azospirillum canadense]MCW2243622.1 PAS domain S-box-containing protein [Azospirillum canadense]
MIECGLFVALVALCAGILAGAAGGAVIGWRSGRSHDLNALRKADADRRDLAERLEMAFDATNAAAWDADVVNGTCWWSDGFPRLLGFAETPAMPRDFWEARLHPSDRERVLATIGAHLRGDTTTYVYDYRMRREDGGWVWIAAKGRAIRDADGRAVRYLGIMTDITDRKAAEAAVVAAKEEAEHALAELRAAQESLVQAEAMASLGQLVAGVAHEINTPIGIGLTASTHIAEQTRTVRDHFTGGTLKKTGLADYLDTMAECAGLLDANIRRAAALVQNFKQVAVDQASGERRVFDLKTTIDEVLFALRPRLKRTRLGVEVTCPDGVSMDGVPGALGQVLTNLVINAVLHAYQEGEAGTIRITACPEGDDWVVLDFADDGCGVPLENLPKIFEPFFTTKRGQGGSGLGLHIVHSTVTGVLRGTVSVQSTPAPAVGQGTRFTLRLPRAVPPPATGAMEAGVVGAGLAGAAVRPAA